MSTAMPESSTRQADGRAKRPRSARAPKPSVGNQTALAVSAPATRALRAAGLTTLEQVATRSTAELAAMHGVGPIAIARLQEALVELRARP
jgi:hypothetical protein